MHARGPYIKRLQARLAPTDGREYNIIIRRAFKAGPRDGEGIKDLVSTCDGARP